MIEIEQDDSPRSNLGRCKELLEAAMSEILIATSCQDQLPETLRSDFEGDIRWKTLRGLYAAFSKIYRVEQLVHREWCRPPAEIRDIPDDVPDFEPDE